MNIFISTRPGDSKVWGAGGVVVSVWANAAMLRNGKAIRMYFDFIGIETDLDLAGLERDARAVSKIDL